MAFGRPLLEATCSDLPQCEASLKNLLEVILSPEALKQDLPTVAHLLEHPFFESAKRATLAIGTMEKPHFKLSNHLKEALQEAVNKAEQRLRDEQKVARHQKRLVKVQEMMSSEEEMKKRKHKLVNIYKKKKNSKWYAFRHTILFWLHYLQKKEQKLAQEQRSASQLGANGTKQINGKSPERSDSPTSTSTATSVGTLTPPSLRKSITILLVAVVFNTNWDLRFYILQLAGHKSWWRVLRSFLSRRSFEHSDIFNVPLSNFHNYLYNYEMLYPHFLRFFLSLFIIFILFDVVWIYNYHVYCNCLILATLFS